MATHKREPRDEQQVHASHRCAHHPHKRRVYAAVVILTGCLIASLLQGCAGPTHPPRTVCENCRIVCGECEEPDRFVRLQGSSPGVQRDRISNFSHPVTLRPDEWKIILSSLRVQRQGEPVVLFTLPKGPISDAWLPDEVDYLSRTLSLAFAQAQPTEWVVFGLSRPGAPDVSEIATGGWFIEGTHLHLLLANYRYAVTAPNIRELAWENPLSSQVNLYELVPGNHQTVIQNKEGELLRATGSEISIAYQPLLRSEPLSTSARPDGSNSLRVPQSQSENLSLEERLKTLKRLRDQGLISEEEYRIKRSRLLEQL
jgi:putative oligomerization/nucleic acid binding protein